MLLRLRLMRLRVRLMLLTVRPMLLRVRLMVGPDSAKPTAKPRVATESGCHPVRFVPAPLRARSEPEIDQWQHPACFRATGTAERIMPFQNQLKALQAEIRSGRLRRLEDGKDPEALVRRRPS